MNVGEALTYLFAAVKVEHDDYDENNHQERENAPAIYVEGNQDVSYVKAIDTSDEPPVDRLHDVFGNEPLYRLHKSQREKIEASDIFYQRQLSGEIDAEPKQGASPEWWIEPRIFVSMSYRFGLHGFPWSYPVLAAMQPKGDR